MALLLRLLLRHLLRYARYAWALPYTLVGLLAGAVLLLGGGKAFRRHGTVEFAGGRIGRWLQRIQRGRSFSAMTLGHVILAVDDLVLDDLRAHEHVHVRQYERWGPLFVPAYLLSSLLQWLRGRDPYRENHFEREAFALASGRRPPPRG